MTNPDVSSGKVVDLPGEERYRALPILRESFEGIYRWHAKRTLREVPVARAYLLDDTIAGVSLLEWLDREVGYVFYLFVGREFRQKGIGGRLLDDALERFRGGGAAVVFAACEEENAASLSLFGSRGFRAVGRSEPLVRDGGLGAWGYRSRMRVVFGEILLGVRLRPNPAATGPSHRPGTDSPRARDPREGPGDPRSGRTVATTRRNRRYSEGFFPPPGSVS